MVKEEKKPRGRSCEVVASENCLAVATYASFFCVGVADDGVRSENSLNESVWSGLKAVISEMNRKRCRNEATQTSQASPDEHEMNFGVGKIVEK